MPFIDTNHQRAAILVLVLGVALLIALTPYATGLIGIPVLYAVFAPAHDWLAKRASPRHASPSVSRSPCAACSTCCCGQARHGPPSGPTSPSPRRTRRSCANGSAT